jgi:molecular chaperone GrpE
MADKTEKQEEINKSKASDQAQEVPVDNANQEEKAQTEEQKEQEEKSEKKENTEEKQDEKADESKEKDPLEEAEKQIADLKDKYLRSVAEFDNFKKRTLKEKADLILNGGERTVTALLPVLDDMERAIADKSDDPKAIREGVKMIYNKFIKSLETLGVKKIETDGKDFNTDFHEAVAMVPGMGDDKKGKVIDCLQAGYTMNDKVIRHAKVAVAQ